MPACLQIVFKNRVNRPDAILPVDLLSFRISPAVVRDSHFVHSTAFTGKLRDNFGFNTKTIFFYLNRFNDRGMERFVARFHVRQINIGQHVGEHGQKLVAHHMPEKKDAMWSCTQESGTKDSIRFA